MKPALLRPQALRNQQGEVRYYRREGGTRAAMKVVKATNAALDQIELDPGIGSPVVGKRLGIPGLRAWQVAKSPLLRFCLERSEHLDVVRLLVSARTSWRSWAPSWYDLEGARMALTHGRRSTTGFRPLICPAQGAAA